MYEFIIFTSNGVPWMYLNSFLSGLLTDDSAIAVFEKSWKLPCFVFILKERLSRLEAVLAGKTDAGNQELSKLISELQAKLEDANAETLAEREKAKKLAVENEKLKYRIAHLVQAVSKADQKLESMRGNNFTLFC
ncbi:hypothetical protein QUC31_010620 [Theobroma cacao]